MFRSLLLRHPLQDFSPSRVALTCLVGRMAVYEDTAILTLPGLGEWVDRVDLATIAPRPTAGVGYRHKEVGSALDSAVFGRCNGYEGGG